MGVIGVNLSESNIVIIATTEHIAQMAVGFIDLNEPPLSLSVTLVAAGVILDGQTTVSPLDVNETGSAGHSQNFIISWLAVGVVLLEERPFVLLLDSMLVEELVEEAIGIVDSETLAFDLVIVVALNRIRKGRVGLVDVVEASLGVDSVVGVLFGMPLSSQSLVGSFDVLLAALVIKTESIVEVLFGGSVTSSCRARGFAGVGGRGVACSGGG